MIGVMENNLLKQQRLESALENAKMELAYATRKYMKWNFIKIADKRHLKEVVRWNEHMNKMFRELREVTRENQPEKFIGSDYK